MSSIIFHKRGKCEQVYYDVRSLVNDMYNNTKCLLLSVKNSGSLQPQDKTFNDKTWLENSADLIVVNYHTIISPKNYEQFAYTDKIPLLLDYLKTTEYEYVLICDSTDSVIRGNPDDAAKLLEHYDCDILYSSTRWVDHDEFTMPEKLKFLRSIYSHRNLLNSGACVARTTELIKLFERVIEYADYEPCSVYHTKYRKQNGYEKWSEYQLKHFPHGVSDDQTIIRYLFQEFYPKIKIDIEYLLAQER